MNFELVLAAKSHGSSKNGYLMTMMLRQFVSLVVLCSLSVPADEARPQPNVIFVLADDLGIGDLQPTNPDCKIRTPHLQTMANEGITPAII